MEHISRRWHPWQSNHFHWNGWSRLLRFLATIIDESPDTPAERSHDIGVSHPESPALDQYRRHRSSPAFNLQFTIVTALFSRYMVYSRLVRDLIFAFVVLPSWRVNTSLTCPSALTEISALDCSPDSLCACSGSRRKISKRSFSSAVIHSVFFVVMLSRPPHSLLQAWPPAVPMLCLVCILTRDC